MIDITVFGRPAPQGSKKAFLRPGAKFPTMIEASKKLAPWRNAVAQAAGSAMGNRTVWTGPVKVVLRFSMLRPKAHFGSGRNAGAIKASSPRHHVQTPDVDKLARAVLDALTSVVFRDDSQVCDLWASKQWTEHQECCQIIVERLDSPG